jgi:hypothetical protein
MSVKLVSEEIRRFLKTSEPEVICVMGKWGVGKTFAWNKYLKEAVAEQAVDLKRYSYVSLFGQNSLEDLKYSVFESTVNIDQIELGPNIDTLDGSINILKKIGSQALFSWAQSKDYSSLVSRSFFLTVRNQIVCIDDLERVGEGLSIKDILGLVSFLKDQRKCKVVLLLNDEELQGQSAIDFKNQLEKVSDVEMKFEPTATEASEIGIDTSTSFHKIFMETCVNLGIVNIRVIRKIQRLAKRLEELLKNHDKRIFESALPSMTVLGWVIYQPKLAPSLEFMKSFSPFGNFLEKDKGKQESDEEKNWRLLLNSINYTNFDELDKLLVDSIERGYFDSDAVEKMALELDKKWAAEDQDNSFHKAWEKYHGSFSANEAEVLDGIFSAFKKGVQTITPSNLDSTVRFFRKLGRDKQADEMLGYYIKERNEKAEFFNPRHSVFMELNDPAVIKAFKEKLESFQDNRTPEEILIHMAKSREWNPEDISALAKISAEEYYKIFKKTEGSDLKVILHQLLQFRKIGNADEEMRTVSSRTEEALKLIAKESSINRERVGVYGITLEEGS